MTIIRQFIRHKHFFITTPIFYANAPPHIGHLYSAVIADAAYRWNVLKNFRIDRENCGDSRKYCGRLFSTGTDEHGVKIQKAAQAAGLAPEVFCDRLSGSFRELFKTFRIEPTDFIRTTEHRHKRVVEQIWTKLRKRGFIKKAKYSGWYSIVDECFYSEHEIETVKSHVNGQQQKISKQTHSVVEWIEEENYVFELCKFYDPIRHWLLNNDVIYPRQYLQLALNYMNNDEKLSISRDANRLKWGIPVPDDPSQTIYVWMDALFNYLTVSGYPQSYHDKWPPTCQILGKDILKFHAVFWPAFLMAAELPLPKRLFVHAHWLVDGVKMSKSVGNVVDAFQAAETLTVDGLRYFLLRQGTPQDDANFTMKKAVNIVNSELVNNLGNLLQRASTSKLNPQRIYPIFDRRIVKSDLSEHGLPLIESLNALSAKYAKHFDELMIYKALDELTAVARQANAFFQSSEPWKLDEGDKLSTILYICYETVRICGILLQPIVPNYADRLLSRLGVQANERLLDSTKFSEDENSKNLIGDQQRRPLQASNEPIMRRIKA